MKFTSQLLPAVLILSPIVDAQKSTKTAKNSKSAKSVKSSVTCPRDQQHAAAIANRMWGEMWHEIIETDCDCELIAGVWAHRMTDDMTGDIIAPAMEVGGPFIPGPTMNTCAGKEEGFDPDLPSCVAFTNAATCGNCVQKNFLSFSTHGVEIDQDDCMNFIVKLNEFVTAPQNCGVDMLFATGRTYGYRMNENYVEGGDEPLALISHISFNCPFQMHNSLTDCPEEVGGINARIDPNYVAIDETPGEQGCRADYPVPCETRAECLGDFSRI